METMHNVLEARHKIDPLTPASHKHDQGTLNTILNEMAVKDPELARIMPPTFELWKQHEMHNIENGRAPRLLRKSKLDAPAQTQTAAAEVQIPARLQPIVNDLKTHLNNDLQQAGCTPTQITNACVVVARVLETLPIRDKTIEMAFLRDNNQISFFAGDMGREMPLNQAINQPLLKVWHK